MLIIINGLCEKIYNCVVIKKLNDEIFDEPFFFESFT